MKLGLDPKRFRSGLTASVESMKSFSNEIDSTSRKLTNGMATFTKGLAIASATAAAAASVQGLASVVGGLGAAAVTASGALLLLPAAAASAGVAFAALKLGAKGVTDAWQQGMAGLRGPLDQLRGRLEKTLGAGLAPKITEVGKALLTSMGPGFEKVATSANRAMHSVLNMLSTAQRQRDMATISNNSATAFGNLAKAVGPVVAAFVDVAAVGSKVLSGLTTGAQGAAMSFQQMVARMRESGQLESIIRGGLDALKQLGQLLVNIGGSIGAVFGAMQSAGGGALGILVDLTGQLRAFLESARGQQVLTTFFTTLKSTVDAVLPGLKAIGTALVSAFMSIAPSLPKLGEAFSAVAKSVAPLVTDLGKLAGTILPPLIAAITFLGPALGPLAGYVLGIVGAVKAWSLAQAALNLVLSLNPFGVVVLAIGALIAIIALAWQHSETFRKIVTGVWDAVKSVISRAVDGIKAAINWFAGLPDMFSRWFGAAKDFASRKLGELVDWVTGLPGRLMDALGDLHHRFLSAGKAIIDGIWNGIKAGWDWLKSKVSNLAGSLFDAAKSALGIGSPSKLFRDEIGRWIPKGLALGITGNLSEVRSAAAALTDATAMGAIPSPRGLAGARGGGNNNPIRLEFTGDGAIVELIRKTVRTQGRGDVQIAFGQ